MKRSEFSQTHDLGRTRATHNQLRYSGIPNQGVKLSKQVELTLYLFQEYKGKKQRLKKYLLNNRSNFGMAMPGIVLNHLYILVMAFLCDIQVFPLFTNFAKLISENKIKILTKTF